MVPVTANFHFGLCAHASKGYMQLAPVPLCCMSHTRRSSILGERGYIHVEADNFSVRVVLLSIAIAGGVKQVLNPHHIVKPVQLQRKGLPWV